MTSRRYVSSCGSRVVFNGRVVLLRPEFVFFLRQLLHFEMMAVGVGRQVTIICTLLSIGRSQESAQTEPEQHQPVRVDV